MATLNVYIDLGIRRLFCWKWYIYFFYIPQVAIVASAFCRHCRHGFNELII